jgi:type IX secretion system PorP/SprF family membrane protein
MKRTLYAPKMLFSIAVLFASVPLRAQDPQFSQFYAAPVYTNPAMAGAGLCGGRVSANYRNQWPNLPGSFVTYNFSYDQYLKPLSGAFGLMVSKDIAGQGLLSTTSFSGIYSHHIRVNKKLTVLAGIQASVVQKSIDWDKLSFSDMIDPIKGFVKPTNETPPSPSTKLFPNFSTGFLAYTDKFYAGLAVHNLIEPNQSFFNTVGANLPRRYTAHGGAVIPLKKRSHHDPEASFSPNILFMVQDKFTQINLGFYINRNSFVSGLWFRQGVGYFRTSDALMLLVGFRKEGFKMGYSYDITVSDGRNAAPGSHEISVSYEWCSRTIPPKLRQPPCPRF